MQNVIISIIVCKLYFDTNVVVFFTNSTDCKIINIYYLSPVTFDVF